NVTVGVRLFEQPPTRSITFVLTSPVISMRSRFTRFWATSESTGTTAPLNPARDTHGSAAAGGGGGGGGGRPPFPGPLANATAPSCVGPAIVSTPDLLQAPRASATINAARASRRDECFAVKRLMGKPPMRVGSHGMPSER